MAANAALLGCLSNTHSERRRDCKCPCVSDVLRRGSEAGLVALPRGDRGRGALLEEPQVVAVESALADPLRS